MGQNNNYTQIDVICIGQDACQHKLESWTSVKAVKPGTTMESSGTKGISSRPKLPTDNFVLQFTDNHARVCWTNTMLSERLGIVH